jgi:hypothetical protein
MNLFLWLLMIAAAIAAVVMLIRGIVTFLKTTEADLKSGSAGPSASGLKQNRMMMGRIFFQAIAVFVAALLMLLAR